MWTIGKNKTLAQKIAGPEPKKYSNEPKDDTSRDDNFRHALKDPVNQSQKLKFKNKNKTFTSSSLMTTQLLIEGATKLS